jgi:hypothetical protein
MHPFTKGTVAALAASAFAILAAPAAAQFGGPPAPPNTGIPLHAPLKGPLGQGNATVVVDPPKGTLCYMINLAGLDQVTAAHIHLGGEGETGRPVVTLETPDGGTSSGCQDIAAPLSEAILGNPGGYYVNVHTAQQPQGAIRGQLRR